MRKWKSNLASNSPLAGRLWLLQFALAFFLCLAPNFSNACNAGCAASKAFNDAAASRAMADRALEAQKRQADEQAAALQRQQNAELAARQKREAEMEAQRKRDADAAAQKQRADEQVRLEALNARKVAESKLLADKAKAEADLARNAAALKKRQDQAKRDAALAKLRTLKTIPEDVPKGGGGNNAVIDEAKKGLAGNTTTRQREIAGAQVKKAEEEAALALANKNKKIRDDFYLKKKNESNIQYKKRVFLQQKLDQAHFESKKRGYQRLSDKQRQDLKRDMRRQLAISKQRGIKRLTDPVNVIPPQQQTHITTRHTSSGNQKFDKPNFPDSWNEERIFHNTSDVALDPASIRMKRDDNLYAAYGARDGELVSVHYVERTWDGGSHVEIRSSSIVENLNSMDKLIEEQLWSVEFGINI